MHKYAFHVAWSDEDEAFVAISPEFPGLSAFGDSPEEALAEAQVALDAILELWQEEGSALPEPQTVHQYSGQTRLRMPPALHKRLAELADWQGCSLNQFMVNTLWEAAIGHGLMRHFKAKIDELVDDLRVDQGRISGGKKSLKFP